MDSTAGNGLQGWDVEIPQSVAYAGYYDLLIAGEFHGPAGPYRLLSADHRFAMHPDSPVPLMLQESYDAPRAMSHGSDGRR